MSVVPGGVDTDRQPPMSVPLRHFVVGLGFLLAGVGLGGVLVLDGPSWAGRVVHIHLLFVGWVCVTIMGAMTQFVPVWSGVTLYSRRLAVAQLWLVTVGVAGLAAGLLAFEWVPVPAGLLLLAGIWTFVYNVGRTLGAVDGYDVTEGHFAFALACFGTLAPLGALLVVDLGHPVFGALPVSRGGVVGAHATLAVFGAVLGTVVGALYQLGPMFTQTDLGGLDVGLCRFETVAYPTGVVALAVGRLVGFRPVASAGGLLVAGGLLAVAVVLARRLVTTRVDRTPMLSRYAVVAVATPLWAVWTGATWAVDPLSGRVLLGAPGGTHLLAIGVVGFVVVGTLYHVVPFIVWVHRYSDLLGFEDVPMVDDLYEDRLAAVDFWAMLAGTVFLVAAGAFETGLPLAVLGGLGVAVGATVFSANLLVVLVRHGPESLGTLLFGVDPASE